MSWIFTLVFSGLLFSSNTGVATTQPATAVDVQPVVNSSVLDETERFEQTYPLTAGGRVSVSNINGSIVAEAWDQNEVKVVAIKTAETRERLADVQIRVDAQSDRISVKADYDDWKYRGKDNWHNNGKLRVDFQLMIPRGAVLNEIETVNGSVTISNFTNFTKVSAVNGTVKATNLRGTADLSTVNGEVAADFASLSTGSTIALGTVNGRVNLVIPSDANATLKVDSLNGDITNDFGLPVRKGKYVGRDLYGRIGSGDVRIKLESVNGELKIMRQNDGKAPNPSTNLLPQKSNDDDDDWDFDSEDGGTARSRAKANKDIARAIRSANIESAKAVKQAQKELAVVGPEIERAVTQSTKIAAEVVQSKAIQDAVRAGAEAQAAVVARAADAMFFPRVPRVEKRSAAIPVKGVPQVTVNASGCSVRVKGWDKQEVQYAVFQMSDRRGGETVNSNENHNGNDVTITVENPDKGGRAGRFFGGTSTVMVEVYVPRKSNINVTTDGEIRIEGVSGKVSVEGDEESIDVRDVDGSLHVSSTCGRIRVIGFDGDFEGSTDGGDMNLEGNFRSLSASTEDGDVRVHIPQNTNANLTLSSTDVDINGLPATLIRRNDEAVQYKIGNGSANYRISSRGQIQVANSEEIFATK